LETRPDNDGLTARGSPHAGVASRGGAVRRPGLDVPAEEQESVSRQLMEEHSCLPVFIRDDLADMHYNGFSNRCVAGGQRPARVPAGCSAYRGWWGVPVAVAHRSILWPLFHYLPGEVNFVERDYEAYVEVNRTFADAVAKIVHNGDSVWVQDYHLMLMPEMLRNSLPPNVHVRIGFFLHTPFPSSEIYRILPVRRQILTGLLHCDLIGFHTYDYARHFLSSCTRILSLQTAPNGVEYEGRFVEVGTFPVGIEPELYDKARGEWRRPWPGCAATNTQRRPRPCPCPHCCSNLQGLRQPAIRERIDQLRAKFHGKKIIVGVDRLDYIKGRWRGGELEARSQADADGGVVVSLWPGSPPRAGVPQKLHAFEVFLRKHPEFKEKVRPGAIVLAGCRTRR